VYFCFVFQERRDDLQVIVGAIGKNPQMPKVTPVMMHEIEKVCKLKKTTHISRHLFQFTNNPHSFCHISFQTKNNLIAHADSIELSLTELKNGTKIANANGNGNGNGSNATTRQGK